VPICNLEILSQTLVYKDIPIKVVKDKIMFYFFGPEDHDSTHHYYWKEVKKEHLQKEVVDFITNSGKLNE
jgi:hypothetical protein